ncbi:ABC transporter substrate-binding protein [Yinghuangia aomiensis]|uniref:ABC transporter substrate-binding protein n=1 Tax=Yinghuangia aomiensis TaxID=676205 RepID=A0ABP9HIN4_9ACTN
MAAAVGILVSGCASGGGSPTPADTPRKGGSLTLSLPGDAASFDPTQTMFANVADGQRLAAVYDNLLWTDPGTGTVQPNIAESLVPEREGAAWVLRIRPGVKFSDGTPYDAAAVAANWQWHKLPANKSFQTMAVLNIKALDVDPADPLVLHITLGQANANFDRIVARNLSFIAAPKTLDGAGTARDKPVGAGPFLLKEWTKGPKGRQVYVRNPDYWEKDKGLPYLDELIIKPELDIEHAVKGLGTDADLTVTVDPKNLALARDHGLDVQELRLNGGAMVLFNTATGPFADPRARRAVALALSGSEINDKFYKGAGTPAKGIFSSSSPLANNQIAAPENDGAQAAQLFDEVTGNGAKPLEFTYVTPAAPTTVAVAQYMQAKLAAYRGVSMSIREVDVPTYIGTVRKGSGAWNAAVGQQWIDDPEPGVYDVLNAASFANLSGYNSPAVNAALDEARRTTDTAARREAYTRVQLQVNRDMPFWVYQEAVAAALSTSKVAGLQLFNDGLIHWDRIGLSA